MNASTVGNKQLNFVQQIKTPLKVNGRAAVVLPDNALFFDKRAASETPCTRKLWIYDVAELMARDRKSLDIFWLRDESLANSDNQPPPDVIAQEIVDDLEAALEQFRLIAADLNGA